MLKPEEVATHFTDVALPYYKKLAARNLLVHGQKDVIDHRGDKVRVTGTLYKGSLTGWGSYTDRMGNKWQAWFYNDLKHGIGLVDQTTGIRQSGFVTNGQYHGPLTFWFSGSAY